MINNHLVAVIMCIYNGDSATNIHESILSIINQDYKSTLFLYIDGPINDNLKYAINIYSELDNVFIFSSDQNNGLAFGLNYLIDQAMILGYNYIARMDADDVSLHNRISIQVGYLESNLDIDVCGTFCSEFGATYSLKIKSLPLKHSELVEYSIIRCPFIHPTVMFRDTIFKSGARYPTNTHLTEDMAFWFNLIKNGYRFANIPKVLLNYRMNEDTIFRRIGFQKGLSEFLLRFKYMIILNNISLKNIFLISSRLIFHILPKIFLKFLYKNFR